MNNSEKSSFLSTPFFLPAVLVLGLLGSARAAREVPFRIEGSPEEAFHDRFDQLMGGHTIMDVEMATMLFGGSESMLYKNAKTLQFVDENRSELENVKTAAIAHGAAEARSRALERSWMALLPPENEEALYVRLMIDSGVFPQGHYPTAEIPSELKTRYAEILAQYKEAEAELNSAAEDLLIAQRAAAVRIAAKNAEAQLVREKAERKRVSPEQFTGGDAFQAARHSQIE